MKRFLITLTGRANCIYGKLRGNELVCSYVYANSKKKAVELFWGEIEKNEDFNCYSRRDFKIEAELWNEDELDHFGNPLKDWESAIEFSNLHLIRFNHCTGKYELPDEPLESSELDAQENIQPEPEKATESNSEPQETISDKLKKIADHYGKNAQLGMLQEECAELILAVSKYLRGGCFPLIDDFRNIVEEIADVEVMIMQIKYLLKIPDYVVENIKTEKAIRQLERISESLPDENKEIVKEDAEELTEGKSEAQEGKGKLTKIIHLQDNVLMVQEVQTDEGWAYYVEGEFSWSSAERFSPDDLSRMYENGYFMEELKKRRAKLVKTEEHSSGESACFLRNKISEIDDEIARLFINGAEMKKEETK